MVEGFDSIQTASSLSPSKVACTRLWVSKNNNDDFEQKKIMQFTEKQIDSFIALYEKEFGEKISREEALKQATALVSIVKLTYKPMSKKDFKKYSKM